MDSIQQTLEKINIDLKGKPTFTIILTLIIIIFFIIFKIFFLKNSNNISKPIFYSSIYNYKSSFSNDYYIYASSFGSKYYFYNCKSSIKENNKIYFNTEAEAKQAGYSLAKACQ